MPFPAWHFREMDRGEINVDPVHDEFFKAQDLADALVREAIQNSLDARKGSARVHVRFRIATGEHALTGERAAVYLRGLGEHLPPGSADLGGAMPFLVVEDSGTRGLTGDPGEDPELDADPRHGHGAPRNDFYYFWRNVGRSGKGELDRGRWGLGKAVFSVSSRIRTMFGLTTRADDGRRLLLGQSVQKTHVLEATRFAPYGFFARVARDSFPHAIEDTDAIERFASDFGLQRAEPGLSIVVPFLRHEDLAFDALVRSAIAQYFYPIIRNDLMVTVEENGRAETIASRTIETVAARLGMDGSLARLCTLTRTSVLLEEHEWIAVPEPSPGGAPKWREDLVPAHQLERLRQRFESGEVLAFRLAIPIRRKRAHTAAAGRFSVILEKDDSLRRGEHHFLRRGITIPEIRSPRDKPVRALLIADDEALSTFLGDAENPAHSDWSERNDRIRTQYEQGASTLRYVKNAIAQLAAMLATPPAGRAPDLLADIFSVTLPGEDGHGQTRAARADNPPDVKRGSPENPFPAAMKPQEPLMRIGAVAGGFTLRGTGGAGSVGTHFVAEVAYRTRIGNPFRKYSRFDFALDDNAMKLQADGVTVNASGNRLEVVPARPDFQLALTGFDKRRDLVVRVARKDDDAAEAELH
jgi:hypothetical protein